MNIAIVTGASSGMGREAAIQIADRFAGIQEIWLVARRKERLEELDGRVPADIRCFDMDITCPQERKICYIAGKRKRGKRDVMAV